VRIVSDGSAGSEKVDVIAEVEQHLGENRVRTVAMKATDGMTRGMTAIDTGAPISVPVGPETLGRVLNVLGEPVDYPDRPVLSKERWPIHRDAPTLEQQSTELKMFETGIKVIDLLEPYLQGGKIGLFGGAGVGKTVIIMELINNIDVTHALVDLPIAQYALHQRSDASLELRLSGYFGSLSELEQRLLGLFGPDQRLDIHTDQHFEGKAVQYSSDRSRQEYP
jgi:hypothetical protein